MIISEKLYGHLTKSAEALPITKRQTLVPRAYNITITDF